MYGGELSELLTWVVWYAESMSARDAQPVNPAQYTASQVADYFIYLSSKNVIDEGIPEGVTPLKLQKLLYFGQAASLALCNRKLFEEDIEAWKYGPVISSLYHKYKSNLNTPLVEPSGEYTDIIDPQAQNILKGVWELFDKYSAGELVEIAHQHAPWKNFYKEGHNVVIPPEVMRDYYKGIFEFKE